MIKRLRVLRTRLLDSANVLSHRVRAVFRGRLATHVIVTGTDLPSLYFLVEEIRRLAPSLGLPEHPSAASALKGNFQPVVWSWHPDDITRAEELTADVGRYRRIVVVATSADPRDSVCASDERVPHQYVDGFDYRFRFGPRGKKSLTGPGVLARIDGLEAWRSNNGATLVTVERAQLESEPRVAIESIRDGLGDVGRQTVAALTALMEHTIAMTHRASWTANDKNTRRAIQQIQLSPELESTAVEMGYPQAENLVPQRDLVVDITPGTVIAFHTPDEVYRAEAARLKATLDHLGLDHHFFEVEPEKNWVRTTLLKPSWIARAREELSGPLLYIDVDAIVHEDPWPYLQQLSVDMAAVVYDNGQLNSATLWIADTSGARTVLDEWQRRADQRRGLDVGGLEASGDNGDQGVLKEAVLAEEQEQTPRFSFGRLPSNLAYIFDRTESTYLVGPVIIEQLQVSRESFGHTKRLERRRDRLKELEKAAASNTPGAQDQGSSAQRTSES